MRIFFLLLFVQCFLMKTSSAQNYSIKKDSIALAVYLIELKELGNEHGVFDEPNEVIIIPFAEHPIFSITDLIAKRKSNSFNGLFLKNIDALVIHGGLLYSGRDADSTSDFNKNVEILNEIKFTKYNKLPIKYKSYNEYSLVLANIRWVGYHITNLGKREDRYKKAYFEEVAGADGINFNYFLPLNILSK